MMKYDKMIVKGVMAMFISYDKLWEILRERHIKKCDFAEAVGISSRTLAKLSKNESVTTDTLLRICEVLHCRVEDVLTFEETMVIRSVYEAYRKTATLTAEDELTKTYAFTFEDKRIEAIVTKKTANKHSIITCQNEEIYWKQLQPLYRLQGIHYTSGEETFFGKVRPASDGTYRLFIISGKPGSIGGLDDGFFRSARHPGGSDVLHVMSMAAFKCFAFA